MSDPFAAMRVVCTGLFHQRAFDEAIDFEATSVMAYRLSRDFGELKFKEGAKPTVFVVQKLPRALLRGPLAHTENLPEKRLLAFKLACHRIELPDGNVMSPQDKWCEKGISGTTVASDEWADLVADKFSQDTIDEIGLVAIDFARLAKDAAGPFSLRHT